MFCLLAFHSSLLSQVLETRAEASKTHTLRNNRLLETKSSRRLSVARAVCKKHRKCIGLHHRLYTQMFCGSNSVVLTSALPMIGSRAIQSLPKIGFSFRFKQLVTTTSTNRGRPDHATPFTHHRLWEKVETPLALLALLWQQPRRSSRTHSRAKRMACFYTGGLAEGNGGGGRCQRTCLHQQSILRTARMRKWGRGERPQPIAGTARMRTAQGGGKGRTPSNGGGSEGTSAHAES